MSLSLVFRSKYFLMAVSSLLTLLAMEFVLNFIGPGELQEKRNDRSYRSFIWNRSNTQFDPELGYMHRPNLDVPFENWEYKTRIQTNSQGFRDDEASLEDPDILLVGDSFCFGWGVNKEETAEAVMERETGKKVLNLGVAGFGTIQQFLLLQRYCETANATGCEVAILYYINDRIENYVPPGAVVPTVRKEGGRIVFTPATEEAYDATMNTFETCFLSELSRTSAVMDLAVGTLFNPRRGIMFNHSFTPDMWEGGELLYPGTPVGPFEVLEYLLRILKVYGLERDLQISVVLLPFYTHYDPRLEFRDYSTEERVFRALEIPHRDLLDDFSQEDFFHADRHLTPGGQEKLGKEIAKFLQVKNAR